MRLSYPVWRKLPDDPRIAIATCDVCRFWRRYIVPCAAHEVTR